MIYSEKNNKVVVYEDEELNAKIVNAQSYIKDKEYVLVYIIEDKKDGVDIVYDFNKCIEENPEEVDVCMFTSTYVFKQRKVTFEKMKKYVIRLAQNIR